MITVLLTAFSLPVIFIAGRVFMLRCGRMRYESSLHTRLHQFDWSIQMFLLEWLPVD